MGFTQWPVLFRLDTNFFFVFGIILFAFACQTNVMPLTSEDTVCARSCAFWEVRAGSCVGVRS